MFASLGVCKSRCNMWRYIVCDLPLHWLFLFYLMTQFLLQMMYTIYHTDLYEWRANGGYWQWPILKGYLRPFTCRDGGKLGEPYSKWPVSQIQTV
jgi:hypothetical protein